MLIKIIYILILQSLIAPAKAQTQIKVIKKIETVDKNLSDTLPPTPEQPDLEEPQKKPPSTKKKRSQYRLGLGLAVVDETDDRFRPALQLHFAWKRWAARLHYLDRQAKAFEDQTYMLSGTYNFMFGSIPFLKTKIYGGAGLGITYVRQKGLLDQLSDEDKSYGFAGVVNLEARKKWRQLVFSAGWESHIYLVNTSSIYLVFARRQALYLQVDYRI